MRKRKIKLGKKIEADASLMLTDVNVGVRSGKTRLIFEVFEDEEHYQDVDELPLMASTIPTPRFVIELTGNLRKQFLKRGNDLSAASDNLIDEMKSALRTDEETGEVTWELPKKYKGDLDGTPAHWFKELFNNTLSPPDEEFSKRKQILI